MSRVERVAASVGKIDALLQSIVNEVDSAQDEVNISLAMEDECKNKNARLRNPVKSALTYIAYEGCGMDEPKIGSGSTLTSCDVCQHYETDQCAYAIMKEALELGIEVSE